MYFNQICIYRCNIARREDKTSNAKSKKWLNIDEIVEIALCCGNVIVFSMRDSQYVKILFYPVYNVEREEKAAPNRLWDYRVQLRNTRLERNWERHRLGLQDGDKNEMQSSSRCETASGISPIILSIKAQSNSDMVVLRLCSNKIHVWRD